MVYSLSGRAISPLKVYLSFNEERMLVYLYEKGQNYGRVVFEGCEADEIAASFSEAINSAHRVLNLAISNMDSVVKDRAFYHAALYEIASFISEKCQRSSNFDIYGVKHQ